MATNVKIRKIGNSLGILMPKEVVEQLQVKEGDALYLSVEPGQGLRATPYDPNFGKAMDAFEKTRRKYRNALNKLAK